MNQDIPPDLREKAIKAVRLASDRLSTMRSRPQVHADREITEAIAAACNEAGISPQDYRVLVDGSPELAELEREAIGEGRFGVTDPGPYASISRESPSGKEGDTTKNRTHAPVSSK